ncbi:MAG: GYD domain-containing protein [Thaumarchaeota archaeon]|nr:GYD domain-containing protein [Nitrososphaerota archaeon]
MILQVMPLYVRLIKYTDQGLKTLKDLPSRLSSVRKIVEANGGKLVSSYVTLGPYDVVSILEAPSDEAAFKIGVQIAAQGNLSSQTMRAITMSEFVKLTRGPSKAKGK